MGIVDKKNLKIAVSDIETADRAVPLSEIAFRTLRQKILRGEIVPGEKLRIEVLQREHSLSSSPLREALNRLVAEGLVTSDDHRGFRAAPMSVADLNDITSYRLVIEPAALAQSVTHGSDEWEGNVVAAFHRLERVDAKVVQNNDEWTQRHKDFHMALVAAASSARIVAACSSLFDQAERYRRFSLMNRTKPRNTAAEHKRLMEAAIGRQSELATALLKEHIQLTAQNVMEIELPTAKR
jgi:GntR family transcriptional regulator, carbon starvation induced regulator